MSSKRLDALVSDDDFPAALASVTTRDGRVRNYTAGVGDLKTHSAVPVDGQVRIGGNTKVFTAVTVLQLVGAGRIGPDEPVETYLPGLIRGDGIDGRNITVRQILQHTSGLPDYTNTNYIVAGMIEGHRTSAGRGDHQPRDQPRRTAAHLLPQARRRDDPRAPPPRLPPRRPEGAPDRRHRHRPLPVTPGSPSAAADTAFDRPVRATCSH